MGGRADATVAPIRQKELEIPSFRNSCQGARVQLKTYMMRRLVFLTWAGLGSLWAAPPAFPPPSLKVSGTQIVDGEGKPIALRGVNFGG